MEHGAWGMDVTGEFRLFSDGQGMGNGTPVGGKDKIIDIERRAWSMEVTGEFRLFSDRQGEMEIRGQGDRFDVNFCSVCASSLISI
ncbi:MAG: hypothetical protein IPH20_10045 [Bacteroidales bacterium]|nr:hypothetical protein [Bacteroidales bacterium]